MTGANIAIFPTYADENRSAGDAFDSLADFARQVRAGERVLDAGSGEGRHARYFPQARYCGVDLAVGDAAWNYRGLDAVADLGVAYAALQCVELLAKGAPGIHFYTLNRSPATRAILAALRSWLPAVSPA